MGNIYVEGGNKPTRANSNPILPPCVRACVCARFPAQYSQYDSMGMGGMNVGMGAIQNMGMGFNGGGMGGGFGGMQGLGSGGGGGMDMGGYAGGGGGYVGGGGGMDHSGYGGGGGFYGGGGSGTGAIGQRRW
jgi:hypothetical protein